ncbi:MAG: TolC family protein [Blastocatellia bacterium]|nr:TolC family protein [Blastocatellia bacterium]MCS7158478.1 TolC family protein [Blastocatellia bacterium]MDW8167841.1 TolC family protein [Acidobacteriota bacterium]MDW8255876.1 TolC family protein [Acidobacteriota bacterium]
MREVSLRSAWQTHAGQYVPLVLLLLLPSIGAAQERVSNPERSVRPVLSLSLREAVALALAPEGNARVRLVEHQLRRVAAQRDEVRAAFLPHVEASLSQQNRTLNLDAVGIRIPFPGFRPFVGPFMTFDLRATATQTLFDLPLVRRLQAANAGVEAAQIDLERVRDQVAGHVARLYLAALRAEAALATARANVTLAEALLELARDQKAVGTGIGIEVTRAQVQLMHERQQLLVAENEWRRTQLELLKALGLPLETELHLTDALTYRPMEVPTLAHALETAWRSRADYAAQREREAAAQLAYSATKWERLPSLVGFADYGTIGSSLTHMAPTRTFGVALRLPLFDGGRRQARRADAQAAWKQEQVQTEDLRRQIELEVRAALDSVRLADEQVKVAEEGLRLAERELEQARHRYEAGVTTSLEVTDAQTRLQRARENHIAALYAHNLARLELALAMGTIRQLFR